MFDWDIEMVCKICDYGLWKWGYNGGNSVARLSLVCRHLLLCVCLCIVAA